MSLTDVAVRTAKPGTSERKLADGKGRYLLGQIVWLETLAPQISIQRESGHAST